jgi:hypothetical protein
MFFSKLKKRRKNLIRDIDKLQKNKQKLAETKLKTIEELTKKRGKTTSRTRPQLGFSPTFCPVMQHNLELEFREMDEQPLGLPKGSIRAWITIWVVLQTCILSSWIIMSGKIPQFFIFEFIKWWLIIAGLVIGSYFVTRWKMGTGGLSRFF